MAAPLTPSQLSTLNFAAPQTQTQTQKETQEETNARGDEYRVTAYTTTTTTTTATAAATTTTETRDDDTRSTSSSTGTSSNVPTLSSSPLKTAIATATAATTANATSAAPTATKRRLDKENMEPSPSKARHSRVLSGAQLSPLKMLSESISDTMAGGPGGAPSPDRPLSATTRSPRRSLPPVKRFPVKVSSPLGNESPRRVEQVRELSLDTALRDNSGLQRAIQIFEDEDEENSVGGKDHDGAFSATDTVVGEEDNYDNFDDAAGHDDTMGSTFSTFSAVPNMTMFSKLTNGSPGRLPVVEELTPRPARPSSPARALAQQQQQQQQQQDGNTTNLLLEFTDQLRYPQKAPPSMRGNPGRPHSYAPGMLGGGGPPATPGRQGMNLIDFDIPPAPTPRSVPSITPRELESLKSNLLSEISSLKATLSGKEAEVNSFKAALADAERRAGESAEALREERAAREQLQADRDLKAKEEIMLGQREREELEIRVEEGDKRREAAEMMAQEAESKMAGMRAGRASEERRASGGAVSGTGREVEAAVEKVARELHALYKSKHETKVAALRKSYEGRWEKRVRELEAMMAEMAEDNERLRLGRDTTMTRVDPAQVQADEERRAQAARDAAHIRDLTAEVEKLEAVLMSVKADNGEIRRLLEQERIEKGELVQLAEEMMAMQAVVPEATPAPPRENHQQQTPAQALRTPAPNRAQQAAEGLRGTISRASGLRAPGSYSAGGPASESRIGRAGHERTRSNALPRPGQKSGLQSAIEKMGNHR
ncbi:related to kinetoplast-associated protein KAP [Cephalotrichum gorgonifer]|uniref:Related to kinetoplast-associated protein KAP n=1 Tax=Cephalotrichum gorgonifer TaxID=2041049 RepID=A0AAE8MS34_9PEZI|nr:related to kinetoplast-associated protein KAP [Cephalotrichum gorgonifer]